MKLAVFDDQKPGVIIGDRLVDVSEPAARWTGIHPDPLLGLIENWPSAATVVQEYVAGREGRPIDEVRIRAPLSRPSKILCAGANYMEGVEGNISELDFFLKSPSAIIGDKGVIVLPDVDFSVVHHELELAIVIGKAVRAATLDNAMESVFGYTIFQDCSARGIMRNGVMAIFSQKCWDSFAPMGPAIVTADEIPDPHDLDVRLWVNGELRQNYNTSDMAHRIPSVIVEASMINTLMPGDVIATGCNRQGLGPLQQGDEIVQEITGLGRLTNFVEDPLARKWPYGIDAEFADFVRKPPAERGRLGPPRIVPARSSA